MAKITEMVAQKVIDGFKGVIDFYLYMGVACARKWPRKVGPERTQAVINQWQYFTYVSANWNSLPQEIQDAYNEMASGSGLSGRDLFTRSYLSGLYRTE